MPMIARHGLAPQAILRDASRAARPALCWLGQAGFLLCAGGVRLAIDLYLSDVLAEKYRAGPFPHRRMIPPPVTAGTLVGLDAVFCTHAHTDHMDPGTLGTLAGGNPACRFVVPRAVAALAVERGVPPSRMVSATAGQQGQLGHDLTWHALASAHEELRTNAAGDHLCLGYVLELGGFRVYHSGDCVPYPGLGAKLGPHAIGVALLPVNGRDASLADAGIPGNFTFDEALQLCREAGVGSMIPCHFGMFAFNTVDESRLDRQIAAATAPPECVRLRPGVVYEWLSPGRAPAAPDSAPSSSPREPLP
jgi:L-ascorbate metabolism protein UlaG (beta-lactamase superfamily)